MKLEQWPSKREDNDILVGGTISMHEDVNGVLSTNRDERSEAAIRYIYS
jgi:hypothetical protein